jgi:hypothetical protein
MLKISIRHLAVAVVMSVFLVALTGSVASAIIGATVVCDQSPGGAKYYCTYVNYNANSLGGWNINHRYYMGAIDGGASRWQLWYYRDWYWNGSQWILQTDWGSSGWYENITFDQWREQGYGVSIAYYGALTARTRYYEPVSGTFWCSLIMEHDLWTGNAYGWGTGACGTN